MNWASVADEKRARYAQTHGELDERGLVRHGNVAYAAGLALLMAGDPEAGPELVEGREGLGRTSSVALREGDDSERGVDPVNRDTAAKRGVDPVNRSTP